MLRKPSPLASVTWTASGRSPSSSSLRAAPTALHNPAKPLPSTRIRFTLSVEKEVRHGGRILRPLLSDRLDRVADLESGSRDDRCNRRLVVDIRDLDHAHGRRHLADHLAGGRVFDFPRDPLDVHL